GHWGGGGEAGAGDGDGVAAGRSRRGAQRRYRRRAVQGGELVGRGGAGGSGGAGDTDVDRAGGQGRGDGDQGVLVQGVERGRRRPAEGDGRRAEQVAAVDGDDGAAVGRAPEGVEAGDDRGRGGDGDRVLDDERGPVALVECDREGEPAGAGVGVAADYRETAAALRDNAPHVEAAVAPVDQGGVVRG